MKKNNIYILLSILFIIAYGFILFHNSLYGKFIWDDEAQIVNNPFIQSFKNIPSILTGGTFYLKDAGEGLHGVYYRPLMTISYALIYHFFELNPVPFHFVQLVIHIINSLLLYCLLIRLIRWRYKIIPFLLSLIFLIHPMNSETVSYIANIQDVLMFMFGAIAILYIIHRKNALAGSIISGLLLFFSLLSKETAIVFICIATVYIYLFQKKHLKIYLIVYIITVFIYLYIRCNIAHVCVTAHKPNPIGDLPFIQYLIQLPSIAFYYVKTFLIPVNMSIGQSWVVMTVTLKSFYLPLIGLIIVLSTLLYFLFRFYINKESIRKAYIFFLTSLFLGIGFHLHALPLDFTVADRWFYIPMAAALGVIGTILSVFINTQKQMHIISLLLISILFIFSILTFQRNFDWKDNYTLFSRDLNKSPNSFILENNFGVELYRKGRYKEANLHFQKAVEYSPEWPSALTNLGVSYQQMNNYNKAEEMYNRAIKFDGFYKAYQNYIFILESQGRKKEAILFIETKALKKFPDNQNLLQTYKRLKNT